MQNYVLKELGMDSKLSYRVNEQGIAEYSESDSEETSCDEELDYFNDLSPREVTLERKKRLSRVADLPFFHQGITRNTCEALLLANGIEGSYLVRESGEDEDRYTVSVR